MDKSKKILIEEELKKKAYLACIRVKNSELDAEALYTRPEKHGIHEALARQIAQDVMIEQKKEFVKQARPVYKFYIE